MRGKTLENIVLAVGLLVILAAIFLMFIDTKGVASRGINIIFSIGFIFYIGYSYILSQNLNTEIRELQKHVNNLKEEVVRKQEDITRLTQTVASQKTELDDLSNTLAQAESTIAVQNEKLDAASVEISALKEAQKEA